VNARSALADIAPIQFRAGDRATATRGTLATDAIVRNAPLSPARNYALLVTAEVHAHFRTFWRPALASSREHPRRKSRFGEPLHGPGRGRDVPGALKSGQFDQTGRQPAASLAEGGHLDAARKH